MKFYTPSEADEDNAVSYNGVRQHFQEELDLLLDFASTIARYETVVRVSEDPALHRHIAKLRDRYAKLRVAFLEKWERS